MESKPLTAAERDELYIHAQRLIDNKSALRSSMVAAHWTLALLAERDTLAGQLAEALDGLNRAVPESAGWSLAVRIDGLVYQRDEARGIAWRLIAALDVCDSNRGAFSCADEHDMRCLKARGKPKAKCECGRDELDAARAAAFDALNWPEELVSGSPPSPYPARKPND